MAVIVVLGEVASQAPATSADAANYKEQLGYPDDMMVVSDPSWTKLQSTIAHPSGGIGLPFFVVLDSLMQIRLVSSDINQITAEFLSILAE